MELADQSFIDLAAFKVPIAPLCQFWYSPNMTDTPMKRLPVRFFARENGTEPVRDWLLGLSADDRKNIGADVQTVEFGWPVGMPTCRPITNRKGLWEVRSSLPGGRIARVFFCIHEGHMTLLHGFEKKTQKTPDHEIEVAVKRMKGL